METRTLVQRKIDLSTSVCCNLWLLRMEGGQWDTFDYYFTKISNWSLGENSFFWRKRKNPAIWLLVVLIRICKRTPFLLLLLFHTLCMYMYCRFRFGLKLYGCATLFIKNREITLRIYCAAGSKGVIYCNQKPIF